MTEATFEVRFRTGSKSGAGNDSVAGEYVSHDTVKFSETDRPSDKGMTMPCGRVREFLDGLVAGQFFTEHTAGLVRIEAPGVAEGYVLTTRRQFDAFRDSIPLGDFDDLCEAQSISA